MHQIFNKIGLQLRNILFESHLFALHKGYHRVDLLERLLAPLNLRVKWLIVGIGYVFKVYFLDGPEIVGHLPTHLPLYDQLIMCHGL